MKWLLLAFIFFNVSYALGDDYCERDVHGSCKSYTDSCENDDEPCFLEAEENPKSVYGYPHFEALTQLDGVKVGHTQEYVIDNYTLKLTTRSLRPMLFEIPNAITDDEIEHMIEKASNPSFSDGLFKSEARGGLTPEDPFKPSTEAGRAYGPAGDFANWDLNDDGRIDLNEVAKFCRNYNFLYFKQEDVDEMLKALNIKEFGEGYIDSEGFKDLNTLGIEDYLNRVMREHPKFKQRFSDQIWLPMAKEYDMVFSKIRERFGKLLKIPHKIILGSEHMQIVRYKPNGHYHAHYDSETENATDKPCCHLTDTKTVSRHARCRLCRFVTIMFYLQEPEDGGETAFPAADNITYSDAAFRRRGNPGIDLYNLSEHCYDSNVVIKAKKGTAVLWYNHYTDHNGWLGALDEWSLHGGCEVRKGEKWIANIWLTAPYKDDVDTLSMYSLEHMEKTRNEKL